MVIYGIIIRYYNEDLQYQSNGFNCNYDTLYEHHASHALTAVNFQARQSSVKHRNLRQALQSSVTKASVRSLSAAVTYFYGTQIRKIV